MAAAAIWAQKPPCFPLWLLKHLPNMVAAHVSIFHQAQGPNNTIVTACSASTQGIGEAMRILECGDADVMLAGGSDSRIDPLSLVAYTLLGALSTSGRDPARVSRPFDRDRDGFVLGEGAVVLVLEAEEHAKARGATIYAECVGYGSSFDAFAATQPEPEGRGAIQSMREALKDARLSPDDIGGARRSTCGAPTRWARCSCCARGRSSRASAS